MSRIPRHGTAGTNGHARGAIGMRPVGRVAMLTVTPDRRASARKLRRIALRLASDYGLDHVMVVKRFQDDTVRGIAAGTGMDEVQFPLPLQLVRLYADGHEETLRGGMLVGVERFVLRDIAAAGPQVERTFLAPFQPQARTFDPLIGMPTWMSVPQVLVGEMEILPLPVDSRDQRVIPMPSTPTTATR